MVPCVAGRVVRRCGPSTVGQPVRPIRLPFEICPVAGRAMSGVGNLPTRHQSGVVRIGRDALGARAVPHERPGCDDHQETDPGRPGDPPTHFVSIRYIVMKTVGFASAPTANTVNGSIFSPAMPGEPAGMPGSVMPLIAGRSDNSLSMASTGTCPSTT